MLPRLKRKVKLSKYGGIQMKTKKYLLAVLLIIISFLMSGCANITYTVNLKENGNFDIGIKVLYNDKEFSYNNEEIELVKNEFINSGYEISDINENGMVGFVITKEDIKESDIKDITNDKYKIDIKKELFSGIEFKNGFLCNRYDIDTDVDLTAFGNIGSIKDSEGNVISGEELRKHLSHLNLKLVVKLEKGTVLETNSTLVSSDKKTAEWVLVPGTSTDIELEAITGSSLAITGTLVILGIVVLVAVILLIVFSKMYIKRKKECNDN